MGCSSADCSSAGSTLTYPDILQHNFTILHSNEVGFFAFKREQNYLQNDTKFIVICFVPPEIFYFKQKINMISVTAPSYLTYLFINCDHIIFNHIKGGIFTLVSWCQLSTCIMSLDLTKLLFFTIFSCIKFAQLLSISKTGILSIPDQQGPILDKITGVSVSRHRNPCEI